MLEDDPKRGWILVQVVYPEQFKLSDKKFHARQKETK